MEGPTAIGPQSAEDQGMRGLGLPCLSVFSGTQRKCIFWWNMGSMIL